MLRTTSFSFSPNTYWGGRGECTPPPLPCGKGSVMPHTSPKIPALIHGFGFCFRFRFMFSLSLKYFIMNSFAPPPPLPTQSRGGGGGLLVSRTIKSAKWDWAKYVLKSAHSYLFLNQHILTGSKSAHFFTVWSLQSGICSAEHIHYVINQHILTWSHIFYCLNICSADHIQYLP